MIKIEKITVSYGCRIALSDISLSFEKGDFIAVLGSNGAGKSTLLRALSGSIKPSFGKISFGGSDILSMGAAALAKRRAVLEQECSLDFDYSVSETVSLGGYGRSGLFSNASAEKVFLSDCLKEVGLENFENRKYTRLSGGEKRRVQLARALFQLGKNREGKVLLLDEPSAGLDPSHAHCAMAAARRAADDGACVVAVLHDANLALSYANKAVLLSGGKLFAFGAVSETLNSKNLSQIYGTKCGEIFSDSKKIVFFPPNK